LRRQARAAAWDRPRPGATLNTYPGWGVHPFRFDVRIGNCSNSRAHESRTIRKD
jgi:hypothetical protein